MTKADLHFYREWFRNYSGSFIARNPDDQKGLILKEIHTQKVCENMQHITNDLLMKKEEVFLAECIALFHDVGRFPQLQKYKTFCDSTSVNHGVLGSETLLKLGILDKLPEKEQKIILQAVKYHNAFKIPRLEDDKETHFLKLIRDADKLDIWRVFIEHYENIEDIGATAGLGLPDPHGYNSNLLSTIYRKDIIPLSEVHCLNDYKILQLSWLFDLNFTVSFKLFQERDYLNRILATLPQTDEILRAGGFINDYVNQRIKDG